MNTPIFEIDLSKTSYLTSKQLETALPFDCSSELETTRGGEPPKRDFLKITHAKRTDNNGLTQFPNSSIGKLYSVIHENATTGFVSIEKGSAFVVAKNVLMTAAHCIYGKLVLTATNSSYYGYYQRFEYFPAYPLSTNPIRVKKAWVPDGYKQNVGDRMRRLPYDYGLLITEEPLPSFPLEVSFSADNYAQVKSIGYPDRFPFVGLQYYCEGPCKKEVGNDRLMMENNDMVPGCSGGPWLNEGCVVGLNSTLQRRRVRGEDGNYTDKFEFLSPIIDEEIIDKIRAFENEMIV